MHACLHIESSRHAIVTPAERILRYSARRPAKTNCSQLSRPPKALPMLPAGLTARHRLQLGRPQAAEPERALAFAHPPPPAKTTYRLGGLDTESFSRPPACPPRTSARLPAATRRNNKIKNLSHRWTRHVQSMELVAEKCAAARTTHPDASGRMKCHCLRWLE